MGVPTVNDAVTETVSSAANPTKPSPLQLQHHHQQHSTMAETAVSLPSPPIVKLSEHLLRPNGSISGKEVSAAVLPRLPGLLDALPAGNKAPALSAIDGRDPITHDQIRGCIEQTGRVLHRLQMGRGHRIALVLPNGPELASGILCITTWCTCVPLNAFGAFAELRSDLEQAAIDLVIGLDDHPSGNTQRQDSARGGTSVGDNNIRMLAAKCQIPFCGLLPDPRRAGLFTLVPPPPPSNGALYQRHPSSSPSDLEMVQLSPRQEQLGLKTSEADVSAGDNRPKATQVNQKDRFSPNAHDDEILVLFTSGTTGCKKLVPHRLADVLVATACISVSWKLSPDDTNCNLMPLFHVGGIIRQVFSPILSGGCVICCPSFDPSIFWQLLSQNAFSWYYAAPTMHHLILQTGKVEGYLNDKSGNNERRKLAQPRLRMIANAAGGLLPSLARELRQAFQAHVLPSYGMTECMPITSPPATYQLEKPGTSGVAVGPEIRILCVESLETMPNGKEGAICVRGEPCFRGYGMLYNKQGNEEDQPQTFLPGGWFNTGDLGYMDNDGYLYITGRAKEVINRGGEIISPLEVEEAVNAHPDVQTCVAFSTQHSILQEVVGLLVVPVPNKPRIDLHALHEFLGEGRLAAPKWPQCLVYMNSVPKSHTNKLLRVKLGKRLSLPEVNDSMYAIERTFEAECPPQGTPVSVAIPCQRVNAQASDVQRILREVLVNGPHQDLVVAPHPSKLGTLVAHVYNVQRLDVIHVARQKLDAYAVPSHVCVLRERDQELPPPEPSDAIGSILQEEAARGQGPTDPFVMELQELVQDLLDLDCLPAPDSNFFNLGGSSMLASQLASKVRKMNRISFGGAEVFHHSTCSAIAKVIRDREHQQHHHQHRSSHHQEEGDSEHGGGESVSDVHSPSMAVSSLFSKQLNPDKYRFDNARLDYSSGFFATLFQLVPLFVMYPVWQLSRFFLFFRALVMMLNKVPGVHSLVTFVSTLVIFHLVWVTVTPLLFVMVKWLIIGRYRAGRYPIWSQYYLRWWFVDIVRQLCGRGVWGSNEMMINCFYRMLGANIGRYARISLEAEIAEFDLVSIGEGAAVEYATCRAFGVDNGCMILGPVKVGKFASVGARSVVAPFTSVPDGNHLGPVTSSYEMSMPKKLADDDLKHLRYNRCKLPEPTVLSQIFIAGPISFFVDSMSHAPTFLVLYWMVSMPWHHGDPFDSINDLLAWLCDPRRIPFYIGIRVARAVAAPLVYMMFAIIVKRLVIGKFEAGPRDTHSEWQLIRHFLAARLFSRENMQDCTDLLGRHYELVSWLYRLLGAKVGKRVFWPGHQPIFTGEFDLLEIGDDVVFGSRAAMFCTTTDSCEKITLCAGSNVSDNTVVLPGSILGKNAVLGSNTLCPAGRFLPESSVWFGCKGGEPIMLEKGVGAFTNGIVQASDVTPDEIELDGDESTLRPFGRAFYNRDAPYFVWPLCFIILYTFLSKVLIAVVHTAPILGSLHITAAYYYGLPAKGREYNNDNVTFVGVYIMMLSSFFFTHFARVMIWIAIEVGAKWGFLGKRQEGRYNWDHCDYGQNWELYQIITRIRSVGRMHFLDFIGGTPFMTSFFRVLGSKIGKDCCLYPSGSDPFMPEPDLVEMGDRCVIDKASVVCHLNTRGNFELKKIILENNVTLRARSRIQQGVHMECGSMLLEKSLVMTGEVIEAYTVWQGAPASRIFSYDETSSVGGNRDTEAGSHSSCGGMGGGAFV